MILLIGEVAGSHLLGSASLPADLSFVLGELLLGPVTMEREDIHHKQTHRRSLLLFQTFSLCTRLLKPPSHHLSLSQSKR